MIWQAFFRFNQLYKYFCGGERVVECAVMIELDAVIIRNGVEFVVGQKQHALRQRHRVVSFLFEHIIVLCAVIGNKLKIELHVVPHEIASLAEFEKVGNDFADLGRVPDHIVGNARNLDILLFQSALGIDEGCELFGYFAVHDLDRADLRDRVHATAYGRIVEPRRFQVEHDKGIVDEIFRHLRRIEEVHLAVIDKLLGRDAGIMQVHRLPLSLFGNETRARAHG